LQNDRFSGRSPDGESEVMKTKSRRRNSAEGTFDKVAGRVLEAIGKVTGSNSTKAKGRGARGRGAGRKATGRARGVRR
jgi:uncharacterized protein YjbJ (UPF0337 family)